MDVNWIYCVDYFAIHTNIESLCCIPETNKVIYQLCLNGKTNLNVLNQFVCFIVC